MPKHSENIQRWGTLGGGEGDPAGSSSSIEGYIESELSQYLTLHYEESTLPSTAENRGLKGTFYDTDDLLEYLERGGLVLIDSNGNPQVNSIVHVVRREDPYSDDYEYEVWIDDDTP